MTNQPEIKKSETYQLKMKLLRRIFVFFLVFFLLPLPLIPILSKPESSVEGSAPFYFSILLATLGSLVLIALTLLSIAPVVIQLLDLRKKEKEEKEDPGMFP
jgi:hypothetical protein